MHAYALNPLPQACDARPQTKLICQTRFALEQLLPTLAKIFEISWKLSSCPRSLRQAVPKMKEGGILFRNFQRFFVMLEIFPIKYDA